MKHKISVLGSTGSIGLSTLSIINKRKNFFKVDLLSANKNYKLICKQIKKYKPKYFIINDKKTYQRIKKKFGLNKKKIKILLNYDSIKLKKKSDTTISAIPGILGLNPTILMMKFSKKILLANKESIVCGWGMIKKESKKYKTKVIPIDSEHFSILKLLKNHKIDEVKKIYLTASGGPFLNFKVNQLTKITPGKAVKHPTWKMGKKISVDSATLMNKILELVEAQKLFNIPDEKIDILIHPESLIHAIVEFKNGLSKFLYHQTSMVIPLANAIFNDKLKIKEFINVDKNHEINNLKNLTFKKVNSKIFPIIKIKKRLNEYPSTSIIINASNETLVELFLKKKIPFLDINRVVMRVMSDRNYKKYAVKNPQNIKQILQIDKWAKDLTLRKI